MSSTNAPLAVVQPARVGKSTLQGFLWAGVVVSFCFFMFRIFVRIKVFRRLFPDDALVLAAWFMLIAYAAIWQWCGDQLYLSVAVASGKLLMPPPDFLDQLETFLHGLFVAYYMFYTLLWSIKMSFLLFFWKLGHNVRRQRPLWWSVFAFTVASYAVCLGLVDYSCLLGSKMHLATGCSSPHTIHYQYFSIRFATALDILTDVCIILVSTNILWNLQISMQKKLALAGIFSLTLFIICVSIARVVIATSGAQIDLTWVLFWGGIEASVAIIVACLASFRTLYTRSERSSNRPSGKEDYSDRPSKFRSDNHFVPLKNRGVSAAIISTGEDSTTSFDEPVYSVDDVHVRQDFVVLPAAEDGRANR
ncbi:MAG: hypothetical protein HETSPECPRED_010382 [Heterodermia speciosa]|uniref:Rhodopsin domain-containing protein n=1 Tax=Heterodermia speciosa TaxID=116794 RepID=A0A8H3G5L8_9LECA|nr:MAG: hypothetical protein HETSPECPRED_010382 [Heterodermia speciosa]